MQNLDEEKKHIREQALKRRKAHHRQYGEEDAQKLSGYWADYASSITDYSPDKIISGYAPAGSEINPMPLLQHLSSLGHKICLPVMGPNAANMRFRHYHIGDALCKGGFGMSEPLPSAQEIEPDIVLLPLLGFDAQGVRLGRGGGHYDRCLADLRQKKNIQAIGLAYSCQFFDSLPCAPHDEALNAVITAEQVFVFDAS
ncbi:MAG: 5-formyltetrahydrofolate cyclo-ligase [Parvibaculales bacterium]